jgi:Ca2+-binding RTX toxin-like protein
MPNYVLNNANNFFSAPNIPGNLNDFIWGLGGNDTLFGNAGNDVIRGGTGRDIIYGGTGNDVLLGESGGDVLVGGLGADVLNGGAGIDRAAYDGAASGVRADLQFANLNTGEAAGDSYVSIENMSGSNFGDNLRGNAGSNTIWGQNGNDLIYGRNGGDVLNGGKGNDRLYGGNGNDRLEGNNGNDSLSGGSGNDRLNGGNGLDQLNGGAGNDVLNGGNNGDGLNGGAGNDRLIGGNSRDTLDGGAGDDVFVFNSTAESSGLGADIIEGFDAPGSFIAAGPGDIDTDRIDVSAIDANTGVAGNQSFEFIGEATAAEAFAEGPGVLWVENVGSETNVYGNVDGDAFAELRIRIQDGATDAGTYNSGDFIGVSNLFFLASEISAGDFFL